MTYVRQAKVDRNRKIVIAAVGLVIIAIFLLLGILIINRAPQKEQPMSLKPKAEQAKHVNLLRANQKLQAGETADVSKFEMAAVPKELVPEGAVSSVQSLKGKRITADLEKGEFLLQSDLDDGAAWYEEGDRLMEHTFQDGVIPTTVNVGSVVDVKLFRQGAEDAVVIAKVAVVGKNQNTLSFYLNSSEQEYLKEANTEGQLFLVQYLDKAQPASIISYYPSYGKRQALDKRTESFASSSMFKE